MLWGIMVRWKQTKRIYLRALCNYYKANFRVVTCAGRTLSYLHIVANAIRLYFIDEVIRCCDLSVVLNSCTSPIWVTGWTNWENLTLSVLFINYSVETAMSVEKVTALGAIHFTLSNIQWQQRVAIVRATPSCVAGRSAEILLHSCYDFLAGCFRSDDPWSAPNVLLQACYFLLILHLLLKLSNCYRCYNCCNGSVVFIASCLWSAANRFQNSSLQLPLLKEIHAPPCLEFKFLLMK